MRQDELPHRPCQLRKPHEPHRRVTGAESAWCPGMAAEFPSERTLTAEEAQSAEYERFAHA